MNRPDPHPNADKREVVEDLRNRFGNAKSIVMADYTGMTVADASEFRKLCRKEGIDVLVAKNTLAKLALKDHGKEGAFKLLKGQTMFAVANNDPAAPIRVLLAFAKKHNDKPLLRGMLMDNSVFDAKQAEQLKDLPSREQLIAQILGLIEAPISQLVGVLQEILRSVPALVDAVSQKQSA